ncbi:EVE domain-containing protein [Erysipelothrix sp. HDW6C]|uniref:EVE domain-containing protein n=1 Tax=Erysipelothrix sp. HDW6C TaxID=2714930 RepID=UPI00140A729E|nr:EVE domain-containing protein [Erysipelothrix sp. HDW6C]QIK70357.1 EVE domain-containing protein [Erysipelothrix sp. HDW6C]
MRRYWIAVASYDHVRIGVEQGFAQACHGKSKPLKRMKTNDVVFYYSPSNKMGKKDQFQSFTAMGRILDGRVYQVEMSPGFTPFRSDVTFYPHIKPVNIHDVMDHLEFVTDKQHYGEKFRYGHFEISKKDAETLWHAMNAMPKERV